MQGRLFKDYSDSSESCSETFECAQHKVCLVFLMLHPPRTWCIQRVYSCDLASVGGSFAD